MKRILALLMTLAMLSAACPALAEEAEKSWKDYFALGADALIKDVQEKAQNAADTIKEKTEELSQTAKESLESVSDTVSSYALLASLAWDYAKSQIPEVIEQGKTAASEKVEEIMKQANDALDSASGTVSKVLEQTGASVSEKVNSLSTQVTDLLDSVKETVPEYLEQAGDTLDGLKTQAADALNNAKENVPDCLEQAGEKAADTLNQLKTQATDALNKAKETAPEFLKKTGEAIAEKVKNVSEDLSRHLTNLKNNIPAYAQQARKSIAKTVNGITKGVSSIAQSAKKLALERLSESEKKALLALQVLIDLLKGSGGSLPTPSIPSLPTIDLPTDMQETFSTLLPAAAKATANPFFPVDGYDIYFGMTLKEAAALPITYLSDSRAFSYEQARAMVMLNQENTSLYFLWFQGKTQDATLFEVDEFSISPQDTLVAPQDDNGQYSFVTTDETVNQVYDEKALAFANQFGSALSLGRGLLAPSLMFEENADGISRTQVYFPKEQAGALVVTHFVYTTDNAVNVTIYQHTDAS